MTSHHLDWIVDTLLSQLRLLEQREQRRAAGARLSVPHPYALPIAQRLQEHMPGIEFEVVNLPGRPQILSLFFTPESS